MAVRRNHRVALVRLACWTSTDKVLGMRFVRTVNAKIDWTTLEPEEDEAGLDKQ